MLHLKNHGFVPHDAATLLRKGRSLCSGLNVILRDTRVSTRYLEYDVSLNGERIEDVIERLKQIGDLDHAKKIVDERIDKDEAVKMGIQYFNDERFWEAHEVLEGVWKNSFEGERDLVQGLILVAAALVHHQKNEDDVCLSILKRALEKLSNSDGLYYGIDLAKLCNKIDRTIKTGDISVFKL